MEIVHGDDVAPEPAVRHRGGNLRARIVLEGTPGTPGNYQLSLGLTGEDFVSPRHRHNFEQYRIVLGGQFDFGRDGVMGDGAVAYFPEGVYYGPQSSANDTLAAVLQFGGTSGGGYLSAEEVSAGMEALQASGSFEKGIYRRNEGTPGRKNQDAFEAIWEHINGRQLTYPGSAFEGPVMMDPSRAAWSALSHDGVAEKRLGYFEVGRTGVRLLQLDAGAAMAIPGRGILLVLSGTGTVEGVPYRRLTAAGLEAGEAAMLLARDPSVLLHYDLPDLAGLEAAALTARGPAVPAPAA